VIKVILNILVVLTCLQWKVIETPLLSFINSLSCYIKVFQPIQCHFKVQSNIVFSWILLKVAHTHGDDSIFSNTIAPVRHHLFRVKLTSISLVVITFVIDKKHPFCSEWTKSISFILSSTRTYSWSFFPFFGAVLAENKVTYAQSRDVTDFTENRFFTLCAYKTQISLKIRQIPHNNYILLKTQHAHLYQLSCLRHSNISAILDLNKLVFFVHNVKTL
jgi:hypothetical protein